jgi:sulfatase maturation enzyme AslB (radical SAM superfamily)
MCSEGASTGRFTFKKSIKQIIDINAKVVINERDKDFYKILDHVEIINFTGGETILQKQVHDLIDYLIENDIAKNIAISLLTNASSYPTKLIEKFKQFKNIFYTTSIDGIGDVIEYQRRGSDWRTVEDSALKLQATFGSTVNYVLTAVNVFSLLEWIDWLQKHNINDRIFISVVLNNDWLSAAVIPPELKTALIDKLKANRDNYSQMVYKDMIDKVIRILSNVEYKPELLPQFISTIKIEDSASKKSLIEIVPEWKPYFE